MMRYELKHERPVALSSRARPPPAGYTIALDWTRAAAPHGAARILSDGTYRVDDIQYPPQTPPCWGYAVTVTADGETQG